MRKSIPIALCIMMIASLLCFGASAAEGTAITDAAGFAAMAADGTYYLDADITIDTTYPTAFTGNFDGNGHTITTSVPLFAEVGGGSFKNLTIAGSITVTGSSTFAAGLALRVTKDTTTSFENITNKASITAEYRAGGIVAQINASANAEAATKTSFINCTNQGNIKGSGMVGGIVGYSQGAFDSFSKCVNKGKITDVSGVAGGIIGRTAGDIGKNTDKELGVKTFTADFTDCINEGAISGTSNVGGIIGLLRATKGTFTKCTNKGAVSSTANDAAGIVGHVGSKDYYTTVIVSKCNNYGAITFSGDYSTCDVGCAAGIVGYVYGSGEYGYPSITGCGNYGKVSSGLFASHFLGYSNTQKNILKDCTANAVIEGTYKSIFNCSSIGVKDGTLSVACNVSGIELAEGDATEFFSYAYADSNADNRIKLADYMSQNSGNIKYAGNTPIPNPPTGDSFVIYAIVAIVAVLGVAFISKKKVTE
ncbi:MAG: hypothetical protein MJ102_03535 [Clostridia bacterium]|nr:hypothetical protein [Clostridia bacterium]